jgi:hypothetical protein
MAQPFVIEFDFRGKRYNDAAVGLRAFSKRINSDFVAVAPVLKKELLTFLATVSKAMAERHGNPWPGGTSENTLSKRSGQLIASIGKSVRVKGSTFDNIEGHIGGSFIARVHEYGATIRAKNVKYLTIPLPAALNANGTPKKRSARYWDNTFVFRSKAGNLIIAQKHGKDFTPLYVLKPEVKIRPRLNLGKTLVTGTPYFVDKAMSSMVKALNSQKKKPS